MLRTILIYGAVLALGAVALQWLDYRLWVRAHGVALWAALLAAGFLALGVWVGVRLSRPRIERSFQLNEAGLAQLGITRREHEVLGLLAAGLSNKDIAGRLGLSLNTVKSHIARVYEKLEAARRTDAVQRARELRLIP